MVPPESSVANDIGLYFNDKVIEGIINRSAPFPSNVIPYVNPYQYHPSYLPEGIWFFNESELKEESDFGYWRTKGENSQILAGPLVNGWRRTLEFFEGQTGHSGNGADWVSQEYRITRQLSSKDVNEKEFCLLCNVYSVGEQKANHEKRENNIDFVDTASQPMNSIGREVSENDLEKGSTSGSQAEINGTISNVAGREIVLNNDLDIVPETNYLYEGDYLELLDLEIPASPSPSSSSVSSCVTMSSDECFDALDLLRDLECEKDRDSAQNSAGFKLCVFQPSRPNETVVSPASTGTLVEDSNKSRKNGLGTEAMASTSRDHAIPEEDKKMVRGRKKKLKKKYLCFMPF